MQNYVIGCILNEKLDKILLLKKTKSPEGLEGKMIGKLNFIGGKLEYDETPLEGIIRECNEETGLKIKNWQYIIELNAKFGRVFVFYCITDDIFNFKQLEDEILDIYDLYPRACKLEFESDTIGLKYYKNFPRMQNIDWMIDMILNKINKSDDTNYFVVKEM